MVTTQTERASLLASALAGRLNQLDMSRRELARRTGLSRQTIHNIEHEGNINLKPSTFKAIDEALKWEAGTALALALGKGDATAIEERLHEYLTRIAVHLSQLSTEQLELVLIMMEEHELGSRTQTTAEFTRKVGKLVEGLLKDITQQLGEISHQHAS